MGTKELVNLLFLREELGKVNESFEVLGGQLQYLERLLELMNQIVDIVKEVGIKKVKSRELFIMFFTDVRNCVLSSFSLLLRGHLKQAFACFRPAVEGVALVWQIYKDDTGNKLDLWLECQELKADSITGELTDQQELYKKNFTGPRGVRKDNWPLYRLAKMFEDCCKFGSHTTLHSMRFHISLPQVTSTQIKYSYFNINPNFLIYVYYRLIEMTRHVCAVMCEILSEAFPSQSWKALDTKVLREVMINFIWQPSMPDLIEAIDHKCNEYSMDSNKFKDKILEAALARGRTGVDFLIAWIKSQKWNKPLRAKKAISILENKVQPKQVEPEFKSTGSKYLDPIIDFRPGK